MLAMIEDCLRDCLAADHSECSWWSLSTAKHTYREHQNWTMMGSKTMEQRKKMAWSDESCFLLYDFIWWIDSTRGKYKLAESVWCSTIFFLMTFGPGIYVNVTLTYTTYLNYVAVQVQPYSCGLFQHVNVPCCTAKIGWNGLRNMTKTVINENLINNNI